MRAGADEATIAREVGRVAAADVAAPDLLLDAHDEGASAGLFLALATQWRTGGHAALRTGLDYAAIEPTARLLEIHVGPRTLSDLQLMEAEALKVQAEQVAAEVARARLRR
ncbi:MAG: DUF1799 domain-containing protein [Sphingomonadaceae bacterium]